MKNVVELRQELSMVFKALENDEISYKKAAEFKGICAVMVNSARAQIDYKKVTGSTMKIKFLTNGK